MLSYQNFRKLQIGVGYVALLVSSLSNDFLAAGQTYPAYSQQCADDAGPPFMDDSQTFGSGRYHDNSFAEPVIPADGQCPSPVRGACESTGSPKQAYLEGPVDCGGNGWYCRIQEQEGWAPQTLASDLNFGYCNTTQGFADHGYDGAGHCHGSDNDSTFYWWARDHWFRGYNGRLRCCCGWNAGGTDPVTQGRIVNRCDYRRLVVDENDANTCRDANEGHGLGFNDVGCDQQYADNVGSPLVEDNSQCWEVHYFGASEKGDGDNNNDNNEEEGDDGETDNGENGENGGDESNDTEGGGEEDGNNEEVDEGDGSEENDGNEQDEEGDESGNEEECEGDSEDCEEEDNEDEEGGEDENENEDEGDEENEDGGEENEEDEEVEEDEEDGEEENGEDGEEGGEYDGEDENQNESEESGEEEYYEEEEDNEENGEEENENESGESGEEEYYEEEEENEDSGDEGEEEEGDEGEAEGEDSEEDAEEGDDRWWGRWWGGSVIDEEKNVETNIFKHHLRHRSSVP